MSFIRIAFLLPLFISIILSAFAQKKIKFDKITVDDGLSQGTINAIIQDRHGFMWFATNSGLNRFDGAQFISYVHSDSDSNSISNNIINHIYEDAVGHLMDIDRERTKYV